MTRTATGLGLLGAMILACSGGDTAGEAPAGVPVEVTAVVEDTMSAALSVVGRLAPMPGGSASLTADADAVVDQVLVQVGSPVQKGTPLLHLNAPDLTARAAELDATADVAEHAAQRQADLLAQGIASRKDAEESAAAATAARSAATAARQLLDRTRVASPIAGVVQQVLVQQGERVAAGQPLVEVIDGSVLALVARAPAPEIAPLRVGQRAVVTAEGSGRPWPARVTGIAPAVDSLTNAATIVIRVPNGTGELHAGAGATASIILGEPRQVLVVPADALVLVGGTMSVFVVAGSDSIARARQVTVEMRREGRAAVTGEIARGEVVISRGAYGLSDSTRVLPHSADAP